MYCIHCGKQIPDDSKFCEYCGNQLHDSSIEEKQEPPQETSEEKKTPGKQTFKEKFIEVYTSEGNKRTQYEALTSNAAWEVLTRFAGNTFIDFMEKNPALNKKPHTDIDLVKNEFNLCVGAGYYLWLSEQLYNERELKTPPEISTDDLAKAWQENNVFKDYQKFTDNLPSMVYQMLNDFYAWRENALLEDVKSLHDLPHEIIQGIKTNLAMLLMMGYALGTVEDKYRS